jgi:hypothetical protein
LEKRADRRNIFYLQVGPARTSLKPPITHVHQNNTPANDKPGPIIPTKGAEQLVVVGRRRAACGGGRRPCLKLAAAGPSASCSLPGRRRALSHKLAGRSPRCLSPVDMRLLCYGVNGRCSGSPAPPRPDREQLSVVHWTPCPRMTSSPSAHRLQPWSPAYSTGRGQVVHLHERAGDD